MSCKMQTEEQHNEAIWSSKSKFLKSPVSTSVHNFGHMIVLSRMSCTEVYQAMM